MHVRSPWPAALRPLGPGLLALLISLLGHALWLAPAQRLAPPAPQPSSPLRIVNLRPPVVAPRLEAPALTAPRLPAALQPPPTQSLQALAAPVALPWPDAQLFRAEGPAGAPIQADLPRPQRFHYRLRLSGRPGQLGQAELRWSHDGQQYQLELQRWVDGRPLPTWTSQGRLGEQGLEPTRFEVHRQARLRQALNLNPPVQDRLSWLMQLALLGQLHDPAEPWPSVAIDLVGWRGGVQRWVFARVEGEDYELPKQLLHLRGQHPVDPRYRIDVWLDPTRGFMPRRWVQSFDEALRTELELLDGEPTPATAP